jgi:drug/metabolite transporter (DMT)-like permease
VAYLLYYSLLDRISSTRVVSVTYLMQILGLFWGSIAHEHIAVQGYIGRHRHLQPLPAHP